MEKIKLNNQVVLMRKYVKQAKVHSINKLVKQVKLLQNRKGNEVQISKAKRKAERYLEEISLLKKIKPDYVSKLALSKAKDWKEVLIQKNSTLEDRCIAILASYGPVQKEVVAFHNSNQDLALKISDLIKQWEEKNKFPKDSSQKKKLQGTGSLLLSKMTHQLGGTGNGNSKSLDEKADSSFSIDNSHELRKVDSKIESVKVRKLRTYLKAPQKSFPTEKAFEASQNNEYLEQNIIETEQNEKTRSKPKKLLDNDDENELKNYIDSNAESQIKNSHVSGNESKSKSKNESDMEENEDSENEDFLENKLNINKQMKDDSASESKNESDSEENEDSEDEVILENEHESKSTNIVDTSVKNFAVSERENLFTICSFPAKMENTGSKSGENKLKEITVLNLDDFKDLEEIPVNNSVQNGESEEEEESNDDGCLNNASQNDPFFLGRDEAVSTGNKLVDDPKSTQYVSVNEIFERKEKSNNQLNSKKNFQKPLSGLQFSGKYSSEHRTQKNFKTQKGDKFLLKNHQERFQRKSKDSFDAEDSKRRFQQSKPRNFDIDNFKNRKDFNKRTFSETYRNNRQSNSNDLLHANGEGSFKKSKQSFQKNDVNSKPLHPSWEAKRKQKQLINTSFQGKKIVFED